MKQKKGITLISLVITIVVLMILAGVAISIAVSPDNIFEKANNAKEEWNAKVTDEQTKLDEALAYLGIEPVTEISTVLPDNWSDTKIKEVAKQSGKMAPIPVGYTASSIEGENSISGGLVIYEGNDPVTGEKDSVEHINAMETRNQYVWIPVDEIDSMVMCKRNGKATKIDGSTPTAGGKTECELKLQGNELVCETHGYSTAAGFTNTTGLAGRLYYKYPESILGDSRIYQTDMTFTDRAQTFATDPSNFREPDIVTDVDKGDGTKTYMATAGISDGTVATLNSQLNRDFKEMAKSVAKYGGFYVSRYEAGESGASKKNQLVLTARTTVSPSYPNALAGNMWYGLYNTLRNGTGVDTDVVNSYMIWRKPVRPDY